ncbi:MAG: Aldehyde ferredoxin oxidoreductase [Candidatus Amesbacteria bacterium GW2011_GWA2_42_12]|uniref:Aldehyde ferredoxin oxidoreductase n=1 Tax=Candidatus Amesbacteria bacterium GW2011_GWA2_42_12 TaxID=1618356 RepID=A0A0G1A9Z5_9BACT|nr:MAG: Aldehyde ferredoxin oxidoreductase [Candidatus Amesbacteria bacterium GW2011_GWA2_42_12]
MRTKINTLSVNLSDRQLSNESADASKVRLEERLGGFGKAVHDIKRHIEKHPELRDAYSPENLLCFNIGFLTGSKVTAARRAYVTGLSPEKTSKSGANGIYFSTASSDLGPMIASCGLDSINITGRSESPVYLFLDNKGGEANACLEDAGFLQGKTTDEKIKALAQAHPGAAFAVIGPAGERMVRYASIAFSTYDQIKKGTKNMRFAGRGGMGAVMASKNLLAIAATGKEFSRDVGDVATLNKDIATGGRAFKYRDKGTFDGNLDGMEELGVNVHNNFSSGKSDGTERLYRENRAKEGYDVVDKGCYACGIKCWKENKLGKLDFEPGVLLGINLGIKDIKQTMELINISDEMGVDSMSAGVCLGYEMQKQGKLGDFDFAKSLLLKIARGEHPLKEGLFRYAGNAPDAMHVKGIEFAAYPGNLNPGYAFAIAGLHTSMDTYNGAWYPLAKNTAEEWIENVIRGPQILLYDMNGACKFSKLKYDEVSSLYERVFGEKASMDELRDVAKKAYRIARGIDKRLGFTQEDDVMPEKCFEPYPGSTINHFMTKDFFEKVKQGVYERLEKEKNE